MTGSELIVGSMLVPLIGALVILCLKRFPNIRETVTVITTLITLTLVVQIFPLVAAGERPGFVLIEVLTGVTLAFEVEPLGMVYGLVAAGLWIPTAIYGIGYMRAHNESHQTRFFACFALAIMAALGIAFSANLFTLFLFYELLTLSTYPLVTHYGDQKAQSAGRVYLGILLFTSVGFLLFGIIWVFDLTGTVTFTPGGILSGHVDPLITAVLLALFAFGTGKAALMPFHRWLPAAMVAPTPVSALLHAVAIVKAGVFTILKVIIYIFGVEFLFDTGASVWLMYVAAFTLLSASVIALYQDNLKARLAYSTVSQLAYIVLGGALATGASVMGGGLHIAMHAMGKITLFFCAGAIYVAHHKRNVSELNGLGRKMPFTMMAFLLGSLCIIGLPPMGGSWSKWYLALGALEADQVIFVAVLMISSLLSIGYLIPVVVRAFFFEPEEEEHPREEPGKHGFWENLSEAPVFCVLSLCLTACGCIVLFFCASDIYALLLPITAGR